MTSDDAEDLARPCRPPDRRRACPAGPHLFRGHRLFRRRLSRQLHPLHGARPLGLRPPARRRPRPRSTPATMASRSPSPSGGSTSTSSARRGSTTSSRSTTTVKASRRAPASSSTRRSRRDGERPHRGGGHDRADQPRGQGRAAMPATARCAATLPCMPDGAATNPSLTLPAPRNCQGFAGYGSVDPALVLPNSQARQPRRRMTRRRPMSVAKPRIAVAERARWSRPPAATRAAAMRARSERLRVRCR